MGAEKKENVVRVRLLGTVELETAYGRVTENHTRKTVAWLMLKYLLVNRGMSVKQEEIIDVLWPDKELVNAEGTIRTSASRLRAFLEPLKIGGQKDGLVQYHDGKYWLNPDCRIDTDVDEVDGLIRQIRGTGEGNPAGLELCYAALELFRGNFMEDNDDVVWLKLYQDHYRSVFRKLAETTIRRMSVLKDERPLALLSRRMITIIPDEITLHAELIRFMAENHLDIEMVRHIAQMTQKGGSFKMPEEN